MNTSELSTSRSAPGSLLSAVGIQRPLPPEYKRTIPAGPLFENVNRVVGEEKLNTICVSGKCPNRGECFSKGSLAFMILGDVCTRFCGFCAVKTGRPETLDLQEPERLARAVSELRLRHVVITAVARDDLKDGGAQIFAECIQRLHADNPKLIVEVLTSDFQGNTASIQTVLDARPDIFNHNIETVERLTPSVRSRRAAYRQTLEVLRYAKEHGAPQGVKTKSGLMLGLGETREEVHATLTDLRASGCDYLTMGQYLQPSTKHLMIQHFVPVSDFNFWKEEAGRIGFERVASGPLVRSSYFAEELHNPQELSKTYARAD